jgi:hypothetical protein
VRRRPWRPRQGRHRPGTSRWPRHHRCVIPRTRWLRLPIRASDSSPASTRLVWRSGISDMFRALLCRKVSEDVAQQGRTSRSPATMRSWGIIADSRRTTSPIRPIHVSLLDSSVPRARAIRRCTAICSSSPVKAQQREPIAAPIPSCRIRRARARIVSAASACSTFPTWRVPAWSRTCRRVAARTRTRSSPIRVTDRMFTSTSPVTPECGRRQSWPAARRRTIRPIQQVRSIALR